MAMGNGKKTINSLNKLKVETLSSLRSLAMLNRRFHSELSAHQGLNCIVPDVYFTNLVGFEGREVDLWDIFHFLQRGRFCSEALCAAEYVQRVLLHYTQHAQNVDNAKKKNTRITRKTRSTVLQRQT